jgi:hypothetical protein
LRKGLERSAAREGGRAAQQSRALSRFGAAEAGRAAPCDRAWRGWGQPRSRGEARAAGGIG